MSEHREALEKIANMCMTSSAYGRRLQNIHEIAMFALGMTKGQRDERHVKAMTYCGDIRKIRKAEGWKKAREELGEKRPAKII
jgi:hypothetical protein